MNIVIQKFGGTSLASKNKREIVSQKIIEEIEKGKKPVVVVSAMGEKGHAYATDTLLEMIENGEISAPERQKDLLLSCGEIISSVVLASELEESGQRAFSLTGWQAGIITDERHGRSRVECVDPTRIFELWEQEIVPVVAGFQGITPEGEITTLGRGGSDTTASVLGYVLDAEKVDIYSDVQGLMTSDPEKCQAAKPLKEVTYSEACELAYQGARVIHPRAAEVAMNGDIPLNILPLEDSDRKNGTSLREDGVSIDTDRPATGIATRSDIAFFEIFPDNGKNYATGLKVFPLLAAENISVDFINIRPERISFVVDDSRSEEAGEIMETENFNHRISHNFSKVSLVGGGMTGQPGIMARIVEAFCQADIRIFQTTDSHTTISCLIKSSREKLAVRTLHQKFDI